MIDFLLHSEISGKTQESANSANEQMIALFTEQGVDLKEEFTNALKEIESKDYSEKEVKIVLENAKNEIVENGGDSKQAQTQMNLLLKQILSPERADAQAPNVISSNQTSSLLMPAPSALEHHSSTSLPSTQAMMMNSEVIDSEPTLAKKVAIHDLLLDKSTTQKASQPVIESTKSISRPVMMGGDDFLAQKVLLDKNQMINVEGDKVVAQKLMPQANSLKHYNTEQNILDNRMFVLKASEGENISKLSLTDLDSEDIDLLNEVNNGPERMLAKQVVNNTQNEAQVDISTSTKVLDLSKIDMSKTNELISKISEYIEQAQFEKTQKLDLVVKHDQLGQFKLQVNRTAVGSDLIDIKIQSANAEAHKFFTDNEVDLLQTLSKSGIKVADLKITTGFDSQSLTQQGSQNHKDQNSQSETAHKSLLNQEQKSQDERDSQKRRDLWQQYRERYSA